MDRHNIFLVAIAVPVAFEIGRQSPGLSGWLFSEDEPHDHWLDSNQLARQPIHRRTRSHHVYVILAMLVARKSLLKSHESRAEAPTVLN